MVTSPKKSVNIIINQTPEILQILKIYGPIVIKFHLSSLKKQIFGAQKTGNFSLGAKNGFFILRPPFPLEAPPAYIQGQTRSAHRAWDDRNGGTEEQGKTRPRAGQSQTRRGNRGQGKGD
jgi:hypothetical protein